MAASVPGTNGDEPGQDAVIGQLVRAEAGLIVASLSRRIGDFDIAEEAVQEAIAAAVVHWRREGVPPNPGGWLALSARNRAIDMLRHRTRERGVAVRVANDLAVSAAPVPARSPNEVVPSAADAAAADDRLPMLFGCCHPALSVEARLALTLRAVVGMTTSNIARAFLLPEATVAQRLVRAKRKIVSAGIPFTIPEGDELAGRLDDVLTVILLTYNDGYLSSASERSGFPADAVWLAELVARRLPDQAEAWGVLALLTLLASRAAARHDELGTLVVLAQQDRSRWDAVAVARAEGYLQRSAELRRPGRFQLQAAIAACHAAAQTWADTDWLQILTLYDLLLRYDRSPVVRLNRAIALGQHRGPAAALTEVDDLADRLSGYHLFHATRAQLLTQLGRPGEATLANGRALELAGSDAERALLRSRLRLERADP
jgi:RNA polymerase sigma factor (sigma-70 family)